MDRLILTALTISSTDSPAQPWVHLMADGYPPTHPPVGGLTIVDFTVVVQYTVIHKNVAFDSNSG